MESRGTFDYDSIPPGYYDEVHRRTSGIQSFWHRLKFSAVAREVDRIGPSHVLDVACGPGTFVGNYLTDHNCVGIDLASEQIDYAQRTYEKSGCRFVVGAAPYDLGTHEPFDVITSIEFLEHLPRAECAALLKNLRRHLSPHGTLIVTTPNYSGLWPILEFLIDRFANGPKYDQQHVTKLRRRSLRALIEESGYEVGSLEGLIGLAPFVAAFSWRLGYLWERLERRVVKRSGFLLMLTARPMDTKR